MPFTPRKRKNQHFGLIEFFILILIVAAISAKVSLQQTHQSVFEGDPLELLCKADRRIDSCEFHIQGFKSNIKVYAGVENKNYAFFGGFHHGECGIRIFSADGANHGPATCQVTYPNEDHFGEGQCDVTVFHLPKNLQLTTNKPNFEFNKGERMEFNCSSDGGYPPPIITLLYDKKVVNFSTIEPISWSKVATISDFDKKIECVVNHPNATGQKFLYSRIITVNSQPTLIGNIVEDNIGSFKVGQNATIKVLISAYPKPELVEWTQDGKQLDHNRFRPWKHTEIFFNDTSKEWIFGLDITNVSNADLKTFFELTTRNDLGKLSKNFKMGSTENKCASISAWFIIVILSLLLLLL